MGIGAGQEGGEKRGREERAARARAWRGGREPRSAAPAPASCASRAAARRGPSQDGLARGLPLLLLPRPAAPLPRRAPPAGEWPRRAGGRRPVRHGRGQCRGRAPEGAGLPGPEGERGTELASPVPGLGVRDRAGRGEPRQLAAGEGPGGGARVAVKLRSRPSRLRESGAHTPPGPAALSPRAPARPAPGAAPGSPWGTLPHSQARDRPGLGVPGRVFPFCPTSGKLRQKAGLEEADFTFQPHSSAPWCCYSNPSDPPGHTPSGRLPPCASPLLRGGQAPSLSSNHSYFQEGGVWVEGFLQTNPRLHSAMGARLGEKLTGSGMFQAGEGSWGLAMPFQACPTELLFLSARAES